MGLGFPDWTLEEKVSSNTSSTFIRLGIPMRTGYCLVKLERVVVFRQRGEILG